MRFWLRDDEHADWPEPPAEYVSGLADSVRQARRHVRRDAGRSGFMPSRLVPAVIVALVLAVAAFAGVSTATGAGGGALKSLKSIVVNTKSDHHDGNLPAARGKKGGEDDNDDQGEDDENEGQYDQYDNECEKGDHGRRAFEQQLRDERKQLWQAMTTPHSDRAAHQLRLAFLAHQRAAIHVFNETKKRCHDDNGHHGGHGGHGGDDD